MKRLGGVALALPRHSNLMATPGRADRSFGPLRAVSDSLPAGRSNGWASATYFFTKTRSGGTQEVVANDARDAALIDEIHRHLKSISEQFSSARIPIPATVHGHATTGLAGLTRAQLAGIRVRYREVVQGGQLDYVTEDAIAAEALHHWFDELLADHGPDLRDAALRDPD